MGFLALLFDNLVTATLLQDNKGKNDEVDVEIGRSDPQSPTLFTTKHSVLDEIKRVAGDLLSSVALCELW